MRKTCFFKKYIILPTAPVLIIDQQDHQHFLTPPTIFYLGISVEAIFILSSSFSA